MTEAQQTDDHALIKTVGMVVCSPTGRVGEVVRVQYANAARICRVVFRHGTPTSQWWPSVDLTQATEVQRIDAGIKQPRTKGKAVRNEDEQKQTTQRVGVPR